MAKGSKPAPKGGAAPHQLTSAKHNAMTMQKSHEMSKMNGQGKQKAPNLGSMKCKDC